MPVLNGNNAKLAVTGAISLVALLIVCITILISLGNEAPPEFLGLASTLAGGLVGFLVGTRVVTPDISAKIKTEPLNETEIQELVVNNANK